MAKQTQKEFIRYLLDENPVIYVDEILSKLEESGLSKSKTRKQSYNRALNEILKEDGVIISKEKPKTKETIIQTKGGISVRSDDDFARDDFIDREIERGFDRTVWWKKILKTGKTKNPTWKTSTNIEAVTYEDNNQERFSDMLVILQNNIPEISYIDEAGYDQNVIGEDFIDDMAIYPRIKVTLFSGGSVKTEYIS